MATINGIVFKREVENKIDLMSGPLVLALGQWGYAAAEDVIVIRLTSGDFREVAGSTNLEALIEATEWCKPPVSSIINLPNDDDGTIRYVVSESRYYQRTGGAWVSMLIDDSDLLHKIGNETKVGTLTLTDYSDSLIQSKSKLSFEVSGVGELISIDSLAEGGTTRQVLLFDTNSFAKTSVSSGSASSRLSSGGAYTTDIESSTQGGTGFTKITADSATLADVRSVEITVAPGTESKLNVTVGSTTSELTIPHDGNATIATEEGLAPLLDLKQTVFSGVCQAQYLTANDVYLDCSGVVPRYSINTVKNGTTISASNPLCFFTDGNGVSAKWTFDAPIYVDFAYTAGIWYFHIDTSGVLIATQTPWSEFGTVCTLHRAYIDPTETGIARILIEGVEYHKNDIPAIDHLWKHNVDGTVYINGLDAISNVLSISSTGIPTSPPNEDGRNTVMSITSGTLADENLLINILNSQDPARLAQDLGNTSSASLTLSNSALLKPSYTDDLGALKVRPATRFPFLFNPTTNIPEYITTAGVRTSVTNKSWIVNYVYAYGDPRYGEAVKIRPSNIGYLTYTNALAASWEEIQVLSVFLRDPELRPLYKLIHYVEHSLGGAYDVAVKFAGLVRIDDIRKQKVTAATASTGTVLASSVSLVPSGNVSSTNVQSAIAELDTEKLSIASTSGQTLTNTGLWSFARSTVGTIAEFFYGAVSKLKISDTAITASVPIASNVSMIRENWTDYNPASKFANFCHSNDQTTTGGRLTVEPTGQVNITSKSGQKLSLRAGDVEKVAITATTITALVPVIFPASTAAAASMNTPIGVSPTTPADGDKWPTTLGSFERINGVTFNLVSIPQTITISAGVASVDLASGTQVIVGTQLTQATQFTFTNSYAGMQAVMFFTQDASTARNITLTKTSGLWLRTGVAGFSSTTITIASTEIPLIGGNYGIKFYWETTNTVRVTILK